jgi:hypothetical protein
MTQDCHVAARLAMTIETEKMPQWRTEINHHSRSTENKKALVTRLFLWALCRLQKATLKQLGKLWGVMLNQRDPRCLAPHEPSPRCLNLGCNQQPIEPKECEVRQYRAGSGLVS